MSSTIDCRKLLDLNSSPPLRHCSFLLLVVIIMTKRKADEIRWECEPCPLCSSSASPKEDKVHWVQCENKNCGTWYHCFCVKLRPEEISAFFCESCTALGKGKTRRRDDRPKRAKSGIDYTALDAGEHVNNLRHSYTALIEARSFARPVCRTLEGPQLSKEYLDEYGFTEPIVVHDTQGLDMHIPPDLTVDQVSDLVGPEFPIEVMDVPTQGEDKGWTLGRWAAYYNDSAPTRVRNVISLEVTDSKLGASIIRPKIVRALDLLNNFWPKQRFVDGDRPKVQTYCLMSLQNSYTDFHIDFAGTSVYYHVLQGSKTFLFIPPTQANLKKYTDWCLSPDQSKIFLADECRDTFKVELLKGDTMLIPSGWIHAVHTPRKSLVIGGNFLHLHGMQKHLEVAEIEDKTKVPGKFRFPQLERTLWFSAIGILARRFSLNKFELPGVRTMAIYLFEKAKAIADKNSRKTASDGVPFSHIAGDPTTLAKILLQYVERQSFDGSSLPAPYRMTPEEESGRVILVRTDLSREEYERALALGGPANNLHLRTILVDGQLYAETWVRLPLHPEENISIYGDILESRGTYAQLDAAAKSSELPPVVLQEPKASIAVDHTQSRTEGVGSYHDNSYLPPIMDFRPVPTSLPRPRKLTSPAATDPAKGPTTCFRCKTRKRKCDKSRPCKLCIEVGLEKSCIDSDSYLGGNSTSVPSSPDVSQASQSRIASGPVENHAAPPRTLQTHQVQHTSHDPGSVDQTGRSCQDKQDPTSSQKMESNCGRCARDKKQCGRDWPMCDRCVKKGLTQADCTYSQTSARGGEEKGHPRQPVTCVSKVQTMPISNGHVLSHPLTPNQVYLPGPLLDDTEKPPFYKSPQEIYKVDNHPDLDTIRSLDLRSRQLAQMTEQLTSAQPRAEMS